MTNDKQTVIFILGSGHCGSTLLDMVLGTQNRVFGAGEISQLYRGKGIVCACGKALEECEVWGKVITNETEKGTVEPYRTKKNFILGGDDYRNASNISGAIDKDAFIKMNERLYGELARVSGKQVIVDSSKNPDRLELLTQSERIHPVVVHLVRDGRAVTWSYIRKYKKFFPYFLEWFLTNKKIEILKRRLDAEWMFVRYEDFATDPLSVTNRILETAGLEPLGQKEIDEFRNSSHHEIEGNRMRLAGGSRISLDEKWQKDMPILYKGLFTLFFGIMNLRYRIKK